MELDEIRINERYRKKLGDIKSLAKSIKRIGLLHPIVISEDNELLAGRRRLEALKMLGIKELELNKHYRVMRFEEKFEETD